MRFFRSRLLQLLVDALIVTFALVAAYAIRFEGIPPHRYVKQLVLLLPYLVGLRLLLLTLFGVYRLVWRYVSLRDLPRIIASVVAGTLGLIALRFVLAPVLDRFGLGLNPVYATVPYGVMAAELMLTSGGIIAARSLWRLLKESERQVMPRPARAGLRSKKRALLVGAGRGGAHVAREARHDPKVDFEIVGLLDDNRDKHGTLIHGFPVLGSTDQLASFATERGADLAIISMASAPAKAVRRIVGLAEQVQLKVQIIPALHEIVSGQVNVSKIRDVAIEDLLGRDPVELDEEGIKAFLQGKVVLVTGAGGSIGAEICRQVSRFHPRQLVLVDQAENPLFHIHRELLRRDPDAALVPAIASVTQRSRMAQLLGRHQPQVIFHAAAHKHVPMMEANPGEALRNNVLGSRVVAELAAEHRVEAFVMISTDKAVNPTSVMGASKRLAEMYVQALAHSAGTRFLTVRFGNVLGSEGSVIPLFREQIARGGPVTVTHPEMRRYFMTIPEASQLVLQAATMGEGGEIFILEMGQPIKIVNLAQDLIRLSGLRPGEDIPVVYTGMRPGEKLYEEINLSGENATKTKHPRIWIGKSDVVASDSALVTLRASIERVVANVDGVAPDLVREQLARCVPEYRPEPSSADALVVEQPSVPVAASRQLATGAAR